METKKYTVIPRMPIRGIKDTIITEETELELNELELLKVLLMGHIVLDEDDEPVVLKDIVPEVDPQAIPTGGLVDDVSAQDSRFVASSECKVFGSPRYYKEPVISLVESSKGDESSGTGDISGTPTTPPEGGGGQGNDGDGPTVDTESYGY